MSLQEPANLQHFNHTIEVNDTFLGFPMALPIPEVGFNR